MLSIISFFSFNLEFTNVKKLRAVTFDEFLFITPYSFDITIICKLDFDSLFNSIIHRNIELTIYSYIVITIYKFFI